MVVQNNETKAPTSLIDLLGGSAKTNNSKVSDLFANLLSSLKSAGNEKFNVVVDPKVVKTAEATSSATKTLKSTDATKLGTKTLEDLLGNEETKMLPKELINALSNDQVHSLINKAKEFLKNSITEKAPEYKADSKSLPKTLMGLVELADKMGVNLSEITLSTLDDGQKSLTKELPSSLASKSILDLKERTKPTEAPQSSLSALLTESKNETKVSKEEEKTTKSQQPLQSLLKSLNESATNTPDTSKESPKELSQIVPKTASLTDALSTLLRGNDESDKKEKKESIKVSDEPSKTIQTPKADSLEVKAKEAAQSMRHFAIDLKEAAENYKPPFTRVTMKLNPEKLGEVEVTLVQRGNNVHVNIQSNNASSVAFLAHNATELKAQLAQQGVTNATMNFMSGGENQSQNPNQQQQQQQPNRFQSYQSLQELESNNEQLSALEIILPHYA
ncbi:MAG: flagellar hook-length control protein FliK [Sulfuricurvum sp.]|uniref:flagellar hook-length control protein FliK n=1 Tax=Sulfuricurvum sp. TaxID=2025608 RepID=UPI00260F347D|nr:flagellar hook-length control protein FliK [Sulfuricurvum sp.]MDD2828350.1 flagellar hook-length control protein FliK [Sulfuricurvum sp.]MDD4949355.1 flagellar hook-length control protein FliK [Sulfuricurvum sp.]